MSRRSRTIPTTCVRHGTAGFTNLRVTQRGGDIELDPHVDGGCVLRLNETAATSLLKTLGELLGAEADTTPIPPPLTPPDFGVSLKPLGVLNPHP